MLNQATITERHFPHAYWYNWAKNSLEQAKTTIEGHFYNSMVPMIFSAFCIEAYLNLLGENLFPCWAELERLPHRKKLAIIAKQLDMEINYSSSPFQTYGEIFKFRNWIAHAKPGEFSNVEKLCSLVNACKFLADTESMVRKIHEKFVEHIETHEDEYGEDFFEKSGIMKEDPFGIMGMSIPGE
jgi:hypothetical protein